MASKNVIAQKAYGIENIPKSRLLAFYLLLSTLSADDAGHRLRL